MAEIEVEKKSNNALKYIILFIVFLIIGVVIGFFGTKYYMDKKGSKDSDLPQVVEGPEDITEMEEYKDLTEKLHSFVDGYALFYSTKGIKASSMSNNDRLSYIYDYLSKKSQVTEDKLIANYGSNNCIDQFGLDDPNSSIYSNNNGCTIKKVPIESFTTNNKAFFNDELIDTSGSFVNSEGKLCIVSEDSYLCGNKLGESIQEGNLEAHFSVVKVTKDEGTIVIYDKGYLLDTRSSIVNPDDGYDKYYLHSTDSTDYYHELKNADNLTFKHTFTTKDRVNYYYVSSELVKE